MTRIGSLLLSVIGAIALGAGMSASAADPVRSGGKDHPVVRAGRVPLPLIEAARGEKCVAEPAVMRREHPRMLSHQRDDTVFRGERQAAYSLKACIGCHASSQTGSVAASGENFCQSCHSYAAVKLDCFECHSSKSSTVPTAIAKPARTP